MITTPPLIQTGLLAQFLAAFIMIAVAIFVEHGGTNKTSVAVIFWGYLSCCFLQVLMFSFCHYVDNLPNGWSTSIFPKDTKGLFLVQFKIVWFSNVGNRFLAHIPYSKLSSYNPDSASLVGRLNFCIKRVNTDFLVLYLSRLSIFQLMLLEKNQALEEIQKILLT